MSTGHFTSVLAKFCHRLSVLFSRTLFAALCGWLVLAGRLIAVEPPITAIACSPDGRHILVGSQAGLFVRNREDLSLEQHLPTMLAHVHDLVFSPDGSQFIAAGGSPAESGSIEVWNWPQRERTNSLAPHQDVIYRTAWREDGKQVACAGADHSVTLIDTESWDVEHRLTGHSRAATSLAYLPGAAWLVTASEDASLRVWNLGDQKLVRSLTNHTSGILGIAVQPGSDSMPVIASIGRDRTLRLWQPLSGRMLRFARLPAEPLSVQWDLDGSRIFVSCVDGLLRVLDTETLKIVHEQKPIVGWIYELTVAGPKTLLAAGTDGQIRLVELPR